MEAHEASNREVPTVSFFPDNKLIWLNRCITDECTASFNFRQDWSTVQVLVVLNNVLPETDGANPLRIPTPTNVLTNMNSVRRILSVR